MVRFKIQPIVRIAWMFSCFLSIYVFWPVKSKSDVHFRQSEAETLDNPERNFKFPESYRIQILQVKEPLNSVSSIWKIPATEKIQVR